MAPVTQRPNEIRPPALVLRRPRQVRPSPPRSRLVYSEMAQHQRESVKQVTVVLRLQPPPAALASEPPLLRRPRHVASASGLRTS